MCSTNPDFRLDSSTIIFEDDYLLVINKPPHMLVHPTVKEDGGTLYNYVKTYYEEKGIKADIHPVSRLDRNTSGLVIFAKEPIIQFWLSQQAVDKEYLALVQGKPEPAEGFIEAPIARKEGSIIERCVDYERGKAAKTYYKVLESIKLSHKELGEADSELKADLKSTVQDTALQEQDATISLVQLRLYTGRTHQIRVHMAHIGCPLVNDNLYGVPGPMGRHALHAYKLAFTHPVSDEPLDLTCGLPQDLQELWPINIDTLLKKP